MRILGARDDRRRMMTRDLLRAKHAEILRLAADHGARCVRLFGSVARGEAGPQSDVDLLVGMGPGRSLLDLVALWQDPEAIFGRKVDLLTDGGLSPSLRDRIYAEARAL